MDLGTVSGPEGGGYGEVGPSGNTMGGRGSQRAVIHAGESLRVGRPHGVHRVPHTAERERKQREEEEEEEDTCGR
jgi:hypothetical protein